MFPSPLNAPCSSYLVSRWCPNEAEVPMGFLSQRWGCALGSVTRRGHLEPPLDRLIQRAIVREHVTGEPATLVAVHKDQTKGLAWEVQEP